MSVGHINLIGIISYIFGIFFIISLVHSKDKIPLYKNPSAPIDDRVEDLLGRMSLYEKVGQMNQLVGIEHIRFVSSSKLSEDKINSGDAFGFYPNVGIDSIKSIVLKGGVGSFLHVYTAEEAVLLQKLAMKSRLGIPLIFGIDAVHGNSNCPENTVYPTNIGIASSFDTVLAYTIARQTAKEMRSMNMHWTYSPNADISRDARWGRTGETFGEDPYLVGEMAYKSILGYQGDLNSMEVVAACIKHLAGGGQPYNGINSSPADLSERTLREVYLPPFERGLQAHPLSLMPAHNEISGVPCHANKWLLDDVLRKEFGFSGVIISDWDDIERLAKFHHIAENIKGSFQIALDAGLDMHMHGPYWNKAVCELVREGKIPEDRIDKSVRRLLKMKFMLGLFEQPYADSITSKKVRLCEEHRKTSLIASRESIVLLKNTGILPLAKKGKQRILVTGINADDPNIMGDWTAKQKRENYITILEGLMKLAPEKDFIFINQGTYPMKMSKTKVYSAIAESKNCDVNIIVAGDYMNRYIPDELTCGENADRSDIELPGLQNELIEGIMANGKPTIVILVSGRPLGVNRIAEEAEALIEAWEPGMYGGRAIAEIIFGDVNPSAKLPITIPRSVGQLAIYYNYKPSSYIRQFRFSPISPLYEFGFGLSYTNYSYSDLRLSAMKISTDSCITASVKVKNTGSMAGDEIVQLYINDQVSSVTRPVKELKGFKRIHLDVGEEKEVTFKINKKMLMFYDVNMKKIIEPGMFTVMIGPSSRDETLLKGTFQVL